MHLKNIKTRSNKKTPLMRRLSVKKEQLSLLLKSYVMLPVILEEACDLAVKDKYHAKRSDDLVRIVY